MTIIRTRMTIIMATHPIITFIFSTTDRTIITQDTIGTEIDHEFAAERTANFK